MAHTSEKRWKDLPGLVGVSEQVTQVSASALQSLNAGEEAYQQLQEMYVFVGSTAQLLADQLFFEDWNARAAATVSPDVPETQASASEVAKTQDAIDAMTALHQLFQAATNTAITTSDRLADLRRMI